MVEIMSIPEITRVMELWNMSVKELVERGAIKDLATLRQEVKNIYETSNIYVKKNESGEIVAYASIVEGAYLENIYVVEEYRRKGIGSDLIKHIKSKYDEIITDVTIDNEAGNLFIQSHGFNKEEIIHNEMLALDEASYYWSN